MKSEVLKDCKQNKTKINAGNKCLKNVTQISLKPFTGF